MHEALQYEKEEGNVVHCSLCSHRCRIAEGRQGICGVRMNRDGTLYAGSYGKISAEAVDPIEKKPMYHYLPGTTSYSLGSVGCNFHCKHCQNWHISAAKLENGPLRSLSPDEGVKRALDHGCASIAWTYNEPTIWHEYALDMGNLAREYGLGTVYVTNGYITEEALRELAPMLSAFRVDIKAFKDSFYREVCGAHLQPVLDATILAQELGMHVEIVTLVIPGLNDSTAEMDELIRWVIEHLGPDTPMHFTRFHPDYKMLDITATPVATLERIYEQARSLGVRYPYLGNVFGHEYENTYCPECGALCIERSGYALRFEAFSDGKCTECGERIPIVDHVSR